MKRILSGALVAAALAAGGASVAVAGGTAAASSPEPAAPARTETCSTYQVAGPLDNDEPAYKITVTLSADVCTNGREVTSVSNARMTSSARGKAPWDWRASQTGARDMGTNVIGGEPVRLVYGETVLKWSVGIIGRAASAARRMHIHPDGRCDAWLTPVMVNGLSKGDVTGQCTQTPLRRS